MVASLAVVASCTAGSDDAEPVATEAAAPLAMDFAAPAVGGGDIDLGAYTGRDVALWFWAPY